MSTSAKPALSPAGRLTRQLATWPAVRAGRAECGLGTGFAATRYGRGRQIAHLHNDSEIELYLTWPVIVRLGTALLDSGRVEIVPGGDWIRVRLDTDSDVALAMSLASVAIQATAPAGGHRAPCRASTARLPARWRPRAIRNTGPAEWIG